MKKTKSTDLANVLFPTERQDTFAESILTVPPEQRRLHTDTYDFTVETLVSKLKDGSIFVPEFQRRYVWSDGQASRLIESLIIQCPIPVIYLNQESDERLSIIDGNQRLRSLRRYLQNEFRLSSLTAYPELESNYFSQLDGRFQRHILNRTLRCISILKETHPQVKFDVFERLNSGAVKLTPQELRHGLHYGDSILLAEKIVKSSALVDMLDITTDKRMKAEELVLRFLALYDDFDNYQKPLAAFISSFCATRRTLSAMEQDKFSNGFVTTLGKVKSIFGSNAFKILASDGSIQSKFNAALYDAEMLSVARANLSDAECKKIAKSSFLQELQSSIYDDEKFRKAITLATSDEAQIKLRTRHVARLLAKYR